MSYYPQQAPYNGQAYQAHNAGGGQPYSMPPSAPYQQQQPYGYPPQQQQQHDFEKQQQQPGGGGYYGGGDKPGVLAPSGFEGERFAPKRPKFRDPVFAIIFLAVLGGFIALSVITLRDYSISDVPGSIVSGTPRGGVAGTFNTHTAIILMLSAGVALVFSILYLILVKVATRAIIEITWALNVALNIGYCVYLWTQGFTSGAIIFTIFAVLSVIFYFFARKRIPLARILLKTVLRAANQNKSTYVVSLLGTVIQAAFSVWWTWTLVATYQRFDPNGNTQNNSSRSSSTITGLVVFLAFAFYYITEVLKNITLVTTAGIFGGWYYGTNERHAALSSFKRATTYSLGSICFGSLIVSLLELLRAFFRSLSASESDSGEPVGAILACVAACCIGVIEGLIRWLNKYAYINIALYGSSYLEAARATFTLLQQKGVDVIINDSLVNTVWMMGSFAIGILTALFSYIYLKESSSNPGESSSIIILASFAFGLQVSLALGAGCIGSGVSVLFVALAEDPEVIATRDPELFEMIRSTYPQVAGPVQH
ncbi:pH nine-sensitive protein 1 [Tilletia horrida]|uniref:Protein PNS1 n=1 Tax=Tilletia horrida TaxID=155126 RepID=A0AAN6GIW3_9BASI|nr:pH nine-sensitive protein 1 [Tilletia horrida]